MLPIVRTHFSPNFTSEEIPVEFLVLHYTACTLEETLRIFGSPEKGVCAHFVVDQNGTIYDLGNFRDGPIRKGAHAGKSSFELEGKIWDGFNQFSIGIELVNFNGNLFPYSDSQYEALNQIARHLQTRFPVLRNSHRIVGHEQIAGVRGKADPGMCFDWGRFYFGAYPNVVAHPGRPCVLNAQKWMQFENTHGRIDKSKMKSEDWPGLNSKLESFLAV